MKIEILNITMDTTGVTEIDPYFGALSHLVEDSLAKLFPIREGKVVFHKNLSFTVQPMIGVIGVGSKKANIPTDSLMVLATKKTVEEAWRAAAFARL
ncbi:MAG TPA: hypothetical protein H9858_12340 [Candidatus Blautia stercoravium]|nr:hypothetical protein [Candidatus Blautia stercoravium]